MDGKNVARAVSCEQFFLFCLAKGPLFFLLAYPDRQQTWPPISYETANEELLFIRPGRRY